MAFCSKCGHSMGEGARFCAGCGTPVVAPQSSVITQQQTGKRSFIGNTPQEKLAAIKYVHKRANIIGLEPVDAIVEVRYNGNYEDNDGRILENQG